jgi:hypothetical protein
MPILDNESLLALWLDGELDNTQHALFMQRCTDDPEFAAIVAQANTFTENSEAFAQWSVPQWDRNAAMDDHSSNTASLARWIGFLGNNNGAWSVGLSCCALVIAILTFNNQLSSQATFAQVPTQQDIDHLVEQKVEQKITEQQQNSQALFAQYADALHTQQLATSKQLTEYLLSASRQERKEDFAELVQFINEQRVNDQRFYAQQFNDLQDEIYAINPGPTNISQE